MITITYRVSIYMIFNSMFSYTRELGIYHAGVDLTEAIAKDIRSEVISVRI
jgi:hypothetical protein